MQDTHTHTNTKIKKGDTVEVIAGKDKGKRAIVLKLDPKHKKILVKGVNMVKKHVKPTQNRAGGIIELEKMLPISNVMLVCPACSKRTRVKIDTSKKDKQRVCVQCNVVVHIAKPETKKK